MLVILFVILCVCKLFHFRYFIMWEQECRMLLIGRLLSSTEQSKDAYELRLSFFGVAPPYGNRATPSYVVFNQVSINRRVFLFLIRNACNDRLNIQSALVTAGCTQKGRLVLLKRRRKRIKLCISEEEEALCHCWIDRKRFL